MNRHKEDFAKHIEDGINITTVEGEAVEEIGEDGEDKSEEDEADDENEADNEDEADDEIVIELPESPLVDYSKDFVKEFAKNAGIKYGPQIVGGMIGSLFGPAGTVAGAALGQVAGSTVGAFMDGRTVGNYILNSSEGIDNGEGFNRLAQTLYIHHEALQNGSLSLDQAFSGQSFSSPFSLSQASAEDQDPSSPRRFHALFTGGVDFISFSDSTPDLDFDGSGTAYGLGIDVFPNPDVPLLTGLHLGFTRSHSDFEATEAKGTYTLEMFSLHPSIAWDATDSLTIWATLGYGRPNTETTIDSIDNVDVEDASHTSSGDFFSFAGGASYQVWQSDASALSLNLGGSTASFLEADFQQGRLAAQLSRDFDLNAGRLKSSADLALLLSDSNPSAMELSGRLNWLPLNQGRLSGSTNTRVLLFGDDRSEWGIGGSVTLLPGQQGEGLSLSLQPSFGQSGANKLKLFEQEGAFFYDDSTEVTLSAAPPTARFYAELAYGFRTGNHAVLTPYTKAYLAHNANTYTAGLRYELDTSLDLDLSASHRQRSSGNNDNRFFLQLRSDL